MTDEIKALVEAATAVLAVIDSGQEPHNSAEDLRSALALAAAEKGGAVVASEAALRAERDAAVAREYAAHVVAQGYALGLLGDANGPEGSSDAARGAYVAAKKVVDERNAAVARLPDGMKHCTIQFHECALGHGWLTATNWVQHGCPTCEAAALRASLAAVTAERDEEIENHRYTRGNYAKERESTAEAAARVTAERDHLQARCEAEGAARKRLEEALRGVPAVTTRVLARFNGDDGMVAHIAGVIADDLRDYIDAALETKP